MLIKTNNLCRFILNCLFYAVVICYTISHSFGINLDVQRRDSIYGVTRPEAKRRFMDVLREDMQKVGVRQKDSEDREGWQMIRCNNS